MKPVEIDFLVKNGTKAVLEQINADLEKTGRTGATSVDATTAALEDAQKQAQILTQLVGRLETELQKLNSTPTEIDQSKNIAQIEALQAKIQELNLHIKQLEKTSQDTPVIPPSLPSAKKQFDGLHFSIQQMAREMPSLAMGPQMFFLAISNNLPIFTDELARARREYAETLKTSEKGVPVWKQVTKSLFSWQTAMTTGIMLLVMFGNKLVSGISDMFGWSKAKKEMSEATKKAGEEVEKEGAKISALQGIINNSNVAYEKRISALNELKAIVPGYNASLTTEGELINNNTELLENYLTAFREKIYLKAAEDDLLQAELDRRNALKEIDKEIEAGRVSYSSGSMSAGNMTYTTTQYSESQANKMREEHLKEYDDEIARLHKEIADRSQALSEQGKNSPIYGEIYDNAQKAWDAAKAGLKAIEADRHKFTQKQYDDAVAAEKLAKKAFEDLGGTTSEKRTDSKQDDYNSDRLASIKEAREMELEIERKAITDKIALIEFERKTRIEAIEQEKAAYQKKYKDGDTSGFDRQIAAVDAQAKSDIQEQRQADLNLQAQSMQDYLKEYGTLQQQKYAIAQEYALKISQAQTQGEKMSLQKELDSFNADIEAQVVKMNIDWGTVFGEFGGLFSDMISPALEDARAFMDTSEFKNADQASQQALIEALSQMEQALGSENGLNFKQLGIDVGVYQQALRELALAKEQEIDSLAQLAQAQEDYNVALKGGEQSQIDAASIALENARKNSDAASENVTTLTATASQAQGAVNKSASSLKAGMDNVQQGLSQLASGSLSGAYEGLIQMGKGLGGVMGDFADKLENVPVVGWILSIIDIFKDGISLVVSSLLDSVLGAVSGILDDILSGDLFASIGESLLKGVSSIFDAITFGGWSLLTKQGDADKTLAEDIERLTLSNENLQKAIDNLSSVMAESAVSDAKGTYENQDEALSNMIANTREMMAREAANYTNGILGIGGKHSTNYYIDRGMSNEDWSAISSAVGQRVGSAAEFWQLTPEQMNEVFEKELDLYTKLLGLADDGYGNAATYMEDYLAFAQQREELEEAYYERLTSTSFDSVRESFKSTLLDMESDSSDFSSNVGEMFQNAIVESMMSEKYDAQLKAWYKSFGDAMAGDGTIDTDEYANLQDVYDKMVEQALAERDALKDVFGWSSNGSVSQSGRSGSFETMTVDQGTKLEGLFTSSEMRLAQMSDDLEDVSSQMSLAVGHLEDIATNTKEGAETSKKILEKIEEIIRDGLKV